MSRASRAPREIWEKRVGRLRDSDLTMAEFATEIGVNVHTLKHWKWLLCFYSPVGNDGLRRQTTPDFTHRFCRRAKYSFRRVVSLRHERASSRLIVRPISLQDTEIHGLGLAEGPSVRKETRRGRTREILDSTRPLVAVRTTILLAHCKRSSYRACKYVIAASRPSRAMRSTIRSNIPPSLRWSFVSNSKKPAWFSPSLGDETTIV